MVKKVAFSSPDKDAGWGLIYRLNNLWGQVDPKATSGNFEGWNFVLDRIYCNLLYEDNMVVHRIYECDNGHRFSSLNKKTECPICRKQTKLRVEIKLVEIKSVELSDEDKMVYEFLTKKIAEEKNNKIKAIKASQNPEKVYKGKNLEQSKADYYKALMMKDIWLRKFMQSKGLYLRVVSSDPSNALFGQG